jgi:riboflavin kinase/FMN adenylyltransferase
MRLEIIPLSYPLNGLSTLSLDKPISIAIGHFDGVHRGHQNVIRQAIAAAKEADMLSAVLTFDPHPKEVLGQGDQYYRCLTPLETKAALFAELGVDLVFIMRFNMEFSAVTPERFMDDVLRVLGAKQVTVGFDFKFGHRGSGDTDALRRLAAPDIAVHIVEPLYENERKISSTYVRELLEQGDVQTASQLLGRPYEVSGLVIHGDARGRTIGFPTANLHLLHAYVAPRLGVYAIRAWVDGVSYAGVMNHGLKPTFGGEPTPVMEAHLFDFSGDLYDQPIRIQLMAFLRAERKFGGVDELIQQIEADSREARSLLANLKH